MEHCHGQRRAMSSCPWHGWRGCDQEARSVDQLLVMLVLYRQCLMRRSKTVSLPNTELRELGISRQTKYRALAELEEAGALIKEPWNGRSVQVTLRWFP